MKRALVMSLIGAAGMAAALLAGCGDNDAKPVSSQAGQSCTRTADCADGLSCIANVCYKTAPSTTPTHGAGGAGGEGGQANNEPPAPPPGPVLGGEGESCSSRVDCTAGLACFNQRCTSGDAPGAGGAPNKPSPQLGARGETCRVNADCSSGLICVPGAAAGIGQCDLADYGYKPTGMSCVGECNTAADCCELPLGQHTETINSCSDITAQIGKEDCSSSTIAPAIAALCFLQATYCDCAKNTWSCDDNSRCEYTAKCTAAPLNTLDGCPSLSRANYALPGCNTKTSKCEGAPAAAACVKDTDCDAGLLTADTSEACSKGECTCYSGACYHQCTQDLDCTAGYSCDTKKTSLCVPSTGGCSVDQDCVSAGGHVGDQCVESVCKHPCSNDHDCSPSGLTPSAPFNGLVCSADGFCESLSGECSGDAQCQSGLNGTTVHAFCVTTPDASTVTVKSAITD